jgi:hypothetical protein
LYCFYYSYVPRIRNLSHLTPRQWRITDAQHR